MRERLRVAREAAGLTQEAVAKHFKKPQSFVSKVETGERRIDPTELQEFAKQYGKPISLAASSCGIRRSRRTFLTWSARGGGG
jgi:transcriptional regulator with XRE-family HTH domain